MCAAASSGLALISTLLGRAGDAERHLDDALQLAPAHTLPMATELLAITISQSLVSMLRGDVAAAIKSVDGLHDIRGGAEILSPCLAMAQAVSHRWQGDGVRARSEVDATAARAADGGLTDFQQRTFALSQFLALLGSQRLDEAEAVARGLESDAAHILCGPTAIGMCLLARGDPAGAAEVVRECLDADTHVPHTRVLALWVAAVAGWQRREPVALLHFERALALAMSTDVVGWTVTFLPQPDEVGEMIVAQRARTTNPAVLEVCDLLERAPAMLGAGAALPALTPREREIGSKLGSTLSVPAIAAELFVSVNTVKTQLRTLYRKLGVTTRRDAVELLVRHGVIASDD